MSLAVCTGVVHNISNGNQVVLGVAYRIARAGQNRSPENASSIIKDVPGNQVAVGIASVLTGNSKYEAQSEPSTRTPWPSPRSSSHGGAGGGGGDGGGGC